MPTRVKLASLDSIKKRLGLNENGIVQRKFQNECYRRMDKYVPYKEGNLRKNVDLSDSTKITYLSPYARYIYFGKKMVMSNGKSAFYSPKYGFWSKKGEKKTLTNEDLTFHTAGTFSYWDRHMISVEKRDLIRAMNKFIKNGGK